MPGKRGEYLLESPYIKAKLERLYAPHIHTEQLMDQLNQEGKMNAMATKKKPKVKGAVKPKRRKDGVPDKGKQSHVKGRKKRKKPSVKEDKHPGTRGEAARSGGGNSVEHEESGPFDGPGIIHPQEVGGPMEKEVPELPEEDEDKKEDEPKEPEEKPAGDTHGNT